jgi:YidC/Oxa1 family membrane protein insertase
MDWLLKSQSDKEFIPLIGWENAERYCILPVVLVISQFATQKLTAPATQAQAGPASAIVGLIPLVIGFTALSSPAGLGIYWFINNIVTVSQTYFIKQELGKEFPEYQRILDGTDKKEAEERKEKLEATKAAKEAEVGGLGKGFSAVQAEAEDEAAASEEKRPAWREKVAAQTQAQASRALARRKKKRQRNQ